MLQCNCSLCIDYVLYFLADSDFTLLVLDVIPQLMDGLFVNIMALEDTVIESQESVVLQLNISDASYLRLGNMNNVSVEIKDEPCK